MPAVASNFLLVLCAFDTINNIENTITRCNKKEKIPQIPDKKREGFSSKRDKQCQAGRIYTVVQIRFIIYSSF